VLKVIVVTVVVEVVVEVVVVVALESRINEYQNPHFRGARPNSTQPLVTTDTFDRPI
jgi:hypothetical protein